MVVYHGCLFVKNKKRRITPIDGCFIFTLILKLQIMGFFLYSINYMYHFPCIFDDLKCVLF